MELEKILNSYNLTELKKHIRTYNAENSIKGYSKLTKDELIKKMLVHSDKFKGLKMKEVKEPVKKVVKKVESKKEEPKKEMKKDDISDNPIFKRGVKLAKEAIDKDLKKMSQKEINNIENEFKKALKEQKKPKEKKMKEEESKKEEKKEDINNDFKLEIPQFTEQELEKVKQAFKNISPLHKVFLFTIFKNISDKKKFLTDKFLDNSVTKDIVKNLFKIRNQMNK